MENNAVEIQNIIINQCFSKRSIDFLKEFYNKRNKVEEQLKSVKEKKKQIANLIEKNTEDEENNSREKNENINDIESVLESIERIDNSLSEVLNAYNNIENKFSIISRKIGLKLDNYDIEDDMKKLSNEIDNALDKEKNNYADKENNFLIIDEFFRKAIISKMNVETIKDKKELLTENFKDLTVENLKDNLVLKIYEKRVELPYTKKEVLDYLTTYPKNYKTVQDVLTKEFIVNISLFNKHPVISRFRETYYLCRTREMMSIFDSFNYAKKFMFRSDLNAYIIAATKSKKQLEDYIYCLDNKKVNEYKHFEIVFKVNPLAIK